MSDMKANILNVSYEQGIWHKFYYRQSQNLLKKLIHKQANYYLKPTDIISHRPTLFGYHEPHLEALFKAVSQTNSDFFLDIGANIGLSSVLSGAYFSDIHCVEPNKTLAKILDVNIELNGLSDRTKIHNIGLGTETKTEELAIPKQNFGGAFVRRGNAYDGTNDTAGRTDDDYLYQTIELVEANQWFEALFKANDNWNNGLIKIDVEGFELPIFQSLIEMLPSHISTAIIMENFLDKVAYQDFKSDTHQLEWFGFYKSKNILKSIPFKLLGMSSHYSQIIKPFDQFDKAPHDIIVVAKPLK